MEGSYGTSMLFFRWSSILICVEDASNLNSTKIIKDSF
jgi:hypothetical protein